MRVDKTVEGMGLFIEMEFELSGEFISSFTVELAAICAFDLIIDWLPPDGDNFVLMEGTEASEGNDCDNLREFDMGLVLDNFTLSNFAPYTFVESGNSFVSPFTTSSFSQFSAENWSDGVANSVGNWMILIDQIGAASSTSIGRVSSLFFGVCSSEVPT